MEWQSAHVSLVLLSAHFVISTQLNETSLKLGSAICTGGAFHWGFLAAFALLQTLMVFWTKALIIAVQKALANGNVDDHRSDSESERI